MRHSFWMVILTVCLSFACSDDALPPNMGPNVQPDMGNPGSGTGRRLTIICNAEMANANCETAMPKCLP